jgi:predicted SnoaL-like aldol condensation-catalyzing enzyme
MIAGSRLMRIPSWGLLLGCCVLALTATTGNAAPPSQPDTRTVATGFLHQMFVDADMAGAYEHYAAPDFIQHNPNIGDGVAAHRAYFEAAARGSHSDPSTWANVNNILLVDGDVFALHHHAFRGSDDPGQVFVDIWRVKDGRIVEHWDVIQAIPATMAHHNGMACGHGDDYVSARALTDTIDHPTCGWPDQQASRSASLAVLDTYSTALRAGNVVEAIHRWFTPDYRQHSPQIADGAQGAIAYLNHEFGRGRQSMPTSGPARIIAEGDFILSHRLVHYPGATRKSANVDLFRITHGQISEHWDVKQEVPESSQNGHGMW